MAEQQYKYADDFASIVATTRGEEKWYHVDWKRHLSLKNGYMVVSSLSFFLMALFGFFMFHRPDRCMVSRPSGRCCSCLDVNESKMMGQVMPTITVNNDLYYGIIMVINSGFGIFYVITGVRSENKYQLLCMLATQLLEVARGLVDAILERPTDGAAETNRRVRENFMYAAGVLFFISLVLIKPVYGTFGWRIFRRGGAKRTVRQMYKWYQRYRAFNRLDVQSSFLLFLIFILYVRGVERDGGWVFIAMFFCDSMASRWMVKYLKQEDVKGVVVSVVAKCFVVIWWVIILQDYVRCYSRFITSRDNQETWYDGEFYPDLNSVVANGYNGMSCLAKYTWFDARTVELLLLNFAQAMVFRVASLIVAYVCVRNFGKGLKETFYRVEAGEEKEIDIDKPSDEEDDDKPMQFIPKVRRAVDSAEPAEPSGSTPRGDYAEMSDS